MNNYRWVNGRGWVPVKRAEAPSKILDANRFSTPRDRALACPSTDATENLELGSRGQVVQGMWRPSTSLRYACPELAEGLRTSENRAPNLGTHFKTVRPERSGALAKRSRRTPCQNAGSARRHQEHSLCRSSRRASWKSSGSLDRAVLYRACGVLRLRFATLRTSGNRAPNLGTHFKTVRPERSGALAKRSRRTPCQNAGSARRHQEHSLCRSSRRASWKSSGSLDRAVLYRACGVLRLRFATPVLSFPKGSGRAGIELPTQEHRTSGNRAPNLGTHFKTVRPERSGALAKRSRRTPCQNAGSARRHQEHSLCRSSRRARWKSSGSLDRAVLYRA